MLINALLGVDGRLDPAELFATTVHVYGTSGVSSPKPFTPVVVALPGDGTSRCATSRSVQHRVAGNGKAAV